MRPSPLNSSQMLWLAPLSAAIAVSAVDLLLLLIVLVWSEKRDLGKGQAVLIVTGAVGYRHTIDSSFQKGTQLHVGYRCHRHAVIAIYSPLHLYEEMCCSRRTQICMTTTSLQAQGLQRAREITSLFQATKG